MHRERESEREQARESDSERESEREFERESERGNYLRIYSGIPKIRLSSLWCCSVWKCIAVGKKKERQRPFEVDKKKISQTAANIRRSEQERRQIKREAKGSQCAGKRGGDRLTSNAQWGDSMPSVRFTKISTWRTRNRQLSESKVSSGKDECQVWLKCRKRDYLVGIE